MKWVSHVLIAGGICAVFNPLAVPAAVAGSTAPDWFEFLIKAVKGDKRLRHRGVTHYLFAWLLAALIALLIWDFRDLLFWFSIGGVVHWVCDALTVTGAPVGWWSDRRMTLFGGKVRTGSSAEYIITGIVIVVCSIIIWSKHSSGGFIPFFFNWGKLYEQGIIDGFEWRINRFNFF